MKKRIALLLGTVALVVVGAAMFAAFESHVVDVRAHVEKATYLDKMEIDYGTAFPEQKLEGCQITDPTAKYNSCVQIKLSPSFISSEKHDVTYDIYWEQKADFPNAICPFVLIKDSDLPAEPDNVITGSGNCTTAPGPTTPVKVGHGELNKATNDLADLWDLVFYVPVCSENYNSLTDTGAPGLPAGIPRTVDGCTDPLGLGDSYGEINLGSNLKFQITNYSD
jgi:hypothetical protein